MRGRQTLLVATALAVLGAMLWYASTSSDSRSGDRVPGPGTEGGAEASDGQTGTELEAGLGVTDGRGTALPEVFAGSVPDLEPLDPDDSREVTVQLNFVGPARPQGPVRAVAFRADRRGDRILSALQATSDASNNPAEIQALFEDLVTQAPTSADLRGEIISTASVHRDEKGQWTGVLQLPVREQRYFVHVFGGGFWSMEAAMADPWFNRVEVDVTQGARVVIEVRSADEGALDSALGSVWLATERALKEGATDRGDLGPMLSTRMELDAEGQAVAALVPAGHALRATLRHPSGCAEPWTTGPLDPGETATIRLELVEGLTANGRVVDEVGKPVEGATVRVAEPGSGFGPDDRFLGEVTAGAGGTFQATGLREGDHVFVASMPGRRQSRRVGVQIESDGTHGPIELVLEDGGTITGVARYPGGEPAAGARVRAAYDLAFLMGQGALGAYRGGSAETICAQDGTFALTGLGAGPFSVTLEVEGKAPALLDRIDGITTGTEGLELVARPGRVIRGRVEDHEGTPLVDIPVTGLRMAGDLVQLRAFEVRTDGKGRFVADGLAPGQYRVSVRTDRYATLEPVECDPRDDTEDLELIAPPTVRVTGRVTGPAGQPIEGATVEAITTSTAAALSTFEGATVPPTRTDRRGEYSLLGVPAKDSVSLTASKPNFVTTPQKLEGAQPGSLASGVDFVLGRGGAIEGICFEADGTTSSSRIVLVQSLDMETRIRRPCEPDGTFRIEGLDPGPYQVASMSPEDMAAASDAGDGSKGALFAGIRLARAEVVDGKTVTVFLGDPAAQPVKATGRVIRDGKPVADATLIWVTTTREINEGMRSASTDEDGAYACELPCAGDFHIQVVTFDAAAQDGRAVEFSTVIEDEAQNVSRDFDLRGARIAGRVTGPDGAPAIGVRLSLYDVGPKRLDRINGRAYTDLISSGDGTFEFFGLPPGTFQIAVGGSTLGSGASEVAGRRVVGQFDVAGDQVIEGLEITVDPPLELSVLVTEPNGTPVPGAIVFLRDAEGRHIEFVSSVATDEAGIAAAKLLAPGRYTVCARGRSLATEESDPVEVRAGESTQLRLTAVPASALVVRVDQTSGRPAHGLTLTVEDEAGRDVTRQFGMHDAETLYGGDSLSFDEARFGPLPPGRYRLTARNPAGETVSKIVRLRGGKKRRVTLKL